VCRKHAGELPPPGGPLLEDELIYASHVFDPQEDWFARVDEWPDAPMGGPGEIAAVVERLRRVL
jgi:hypothetical protein